MPGPDKNLQEFFINGAISEDEGYFYSQILRNLPAAFYICNADGYITFYNDAAAAMWGRKPELGKDLWCGSWKIFWPDGRPCSLDSCPMAIALKEGRIVEGVEIIVERPDGLRRHIRPHPRPIFNDQGKLTGAFNMLVDVTEGKQAEQAIRESEQFLQRLISSSDDCIKILDLDGRLIYMNEGGQQLIELEDFSSYTGTWYPGMWKGKEKAAAIKAIQTALDGGTGKFTGYFRTIKTKIPKWWHVVITPIPDRLGRPEKLLAVSRDVTEQKELEKSLSEKNKALRILNRIGKTISGELHLEKAVQKVTDAATQVSGAEFGAFFYNVTDENEEYYKLYTISGVPKEAFSRFPLPRKTGLFAPTFNGQAIIRSDDITKDPRYGKNAPHKGMPAGHLPVASYLAVPVISRTGEVLGGLFFGHSRPGMFTAQTEDIVAGIASQAAIAIDNSRLYEASKADKESLAEINKELSRKNEDLQKMNNDLDNFIYTASHDLKAPVSNIEGLLATMLDSISEESRNDPQFQAVMSMIDQSVSRFKNTILDLTEISKAQKIEEEDVNEISCREIIDNVRLSIYDKILESAAEINIDISRCELIKFSRKNLTSIIYNLLSNAIKYRNPTQPLKISIATYRDGDFIILTVQDNGLGISAANKPRLFTMFKRFHDHVEGTGIGLYIVKRIVDNANGRIEVDSEEGRGTTFRVFFRV